MTEYPAVTIEEPVLFEKKQKKTTTKEPVPHGEKEASRPNGLRPVGPTRQARKNSTLT